jgi:glycosyltransferase involved in cell wall biosynthesis/peptidoglycan/xylan/chitin deacetylase (PgdA/CDA1 family)
VTTFEISVVIPTYNRFALLEQCLAALSRQSQPSLFEVIVVDDGSTDETPRFLEAVSAPFELRIETQPNRGQAAARNRGAAAASSPYCLFVDDDVTFAEDFVALHLEAQRANGGIAALGPLRLRHSPNANPLSRHVALTWDRHASEAATRERRATYRDCWSGNLSVPSEAFLEVGGFAEDLPRNEDVELGFRLARAGLRFRYVPRAVAVADFPSETSEVAGDLEREGAADVELYKRHPAILEALDLGLYCEYPRRLQWGIRALVGLRAPVGLLVAAGARLARGQRADAWFELVTRYCYWRGVRSAMPSRGEWRRTTVGTKILLYHAFGGPNERASRYILPARRLRRQAALLRLLGYRVAPLDEILDEWRAFRFAPRRTIAITIDDGYADNYSVAMPIFSRYGFAPTVFVVSREESNSWDRNTPLRGRPLMTETEVRALVAGGATIGAHTRTHADLRLLDGSARRKEIEGSKADLEERLDRPVALFAYPFGAIDDDVAAAAEAADFEAACIAAAGTNGPRTPRMWLRRIEIRGTYSLARFALTLLVGDTHRPVRRIRERLRL